jgi:hypothetical protein
MTATGGSKTKNSGGTMPEVMSKKVIEVEYPRHHETIASNNYSFRIAAMPGAKKVEVSINESAWKACRASGDSWWYDWSGYAPGEYEIAARVQLGNGHYHATERRFFTVQFEQQKQQKKTQPYADATGQYVVFAANQPGKLSRLTSLLAQEGVNIDSFLMESYGDFASFRFYAEKASGLRSTLESEGYQVIEEKALRFELPNRPGEFDALARKFSEQGISVRYLYGTSQGATAKIVASFDKPAEAAGIVKEYEQACAAAEA